jgi:predicted  nucleic acid-binding Zn-ribbon protein
VDFDALKRKVDDLLAREKKVRQKKAEVKGTLEAKRQELQNLVTEIQDAGYNPRTIKDDYDRALKELDEMVAEYSGKMDVAEKAIEEFYRK